MSAGEPCFAQVSPASPTAPSSPTAPTTPAVPDVNPAPTTIEPALPAYEPQSVPPADTYAAPAPSPAETNLPSTPESPTVPGSPPSGMVPGAKAADIGSTRRFRYAVRLAISGVYDDNVQLTGTRTGGDYYLAFEPGVTLGVGDIFAADQNFLRLDYAPSAYLYAKRSSDDTVQHLIRLEGLYHFPKLSVDLSQDVQILNGSDLNATTNTGTVVNRVNLDVSARTRLNIYVSRGSFTYSLSEKSSLVLTALYSDTAYDSSTLLSSQTSSGDFFYNYTYSPKLSVGVGSSVGYLQVNPPTPNQTFEQLNIRATYQPSGKLSVNGSAGIEFRQAEGSQGRDVITPVLELGVIYQPFDGTFVTLSASRRVLNSAVLYGDDYTASGFVAGVRQRLFDRITAALNFGFENDSYFNTGNGSAPGREDNYFYVQPTIDVRIRDNWTAGVFYTHRQNDSTLATSTFSDNQLGIRTSITF